MEVLEYGAFADAFFLTRIDFNAVNLQDLCDNDYVFEYAGLRTEGITLNIGPKVQRIPAHLFMGYTDEAKLTQVNFAENNSCQEIGSGAFYANSTLTKITLPEGLKKVCANLLRYGATAQIYKEYRTDALADAGLTEEQKAYLTDLNTVKFNDNYLTPPDIDAPAVKWAGVGLDLGAKVVLRYVVDLSDYSGNVNDLTLRYDYFDFEGAYNWGEVFHSNVYSEEKGWYSFDVSTLRLPDMRTLVTAAVYNGDTRVSRTLIYSVDSYGVDCEGVLGELCAALVAVSDCAAEYFTK
jgi:hypothetical protein